MIHELYKKAGELHGHYCPGLAIGVRAAAIAMERLNIGEKNKGLFCIAESRACFIDGIQFVFGTTAGNGSLEILNRGKAAFNFFDRDNGNSLRIVTNEMPDGMSREETIEYILTAPAEQVFTETPTHFNAPGNTFNRKSNRRCPICGEECSEPYMSLLDGVLVCPDCFERGK